MRPQDGDKFAPDIVETLAVRFECTSTRPRTAKVFPVGVLVVTPLAAASSTFNLFAEPGF